MKKRSVALHPEGVDRNDALRHVAVRAKTSPSTRRAWIEIRRCFLHSAIICVSPSTRRAWIEIFAPGAQAIRPKVALHPEGVDRNMSPLSGVAVTPVALHPEGVDRNFATINYFFYLLGSPSTRRAWIEMDCIREVMDAIGVALHPEGVDRN